MTVLGVTAAILLSMGGPVLQARTATDSLRALYDGGVPFAAFLENAQRRKEQWDAHYGDGRVTAEQVARARAVDGVWHVLAVAEDWCGDSANTIPYIARLVEQVDGLDMRVIDAAVGRGLMEAHTTPDGRPATPTVILLDSAWNEVGCFVERPTPLMAWYLENRADKSSDELHEYILDWYTSDAGQATVDDILSLMESAASGRPRCGMAGV